MRVSGHFVLALGVVLLHGLGIRATPQAQNPIPDVHGHIAYVGVDNNLYVFNPHTGRVTRLTQDADTGKRYEWPTWSTDGRLAFFSAEGPNAQGETTFAAHVASGNDDLGHVRQIYEGVGEVFNYAYWSPENCAPDSDCRDLAILLSSRGRGMFVALVRDLEGAPSSTVLPGGPPFYYSWSPNGDQMLWHRRFRNRQQFAVFDANSSEIVQTLPYIPGAMNAPAWSPVDDRLLIAIRNEETGQTDLAAVSSDDVSILAAKQDGLISFAWSPDGTMVAYRTVTQREYGPLYILDATSGDTLARSPVAGVIAFFWSPDSQRVAYVTLATPPGSFNASTSPSGGLMSMYQPDIGLAWSVMQVADSATDRYGGFFPTEAMLYLLTYFDQFAQSHRVWSPDSRHLMYSEFAPGGPVISILDTSRPDGVPVSITDGVIGFWSFN